MIQKNIIKDPTKIFLEIVVNATDNITSQFDLENLLLLPYFLLVNHT
jgi:hypothetical protein